MVQAVQYEVCLLCWSGRGMRRDSFSIETRLRGRGKQQLENDTTLWPDQQLRDNQRQKRGIIGSARGRTERLTFLRDQFVRITIVRWAVLQPCQSQQLRVPHGWDLGQKHPEPTADVSPPKALAWGAAASRAAGPGPASALVEGQNAKPGVLSQQATLKLRR